jgi:phenylalanyl-tRNA synthetase beta chain
MLVERTLLVGRFERGDARLEDVNLRVQGVITIKGIRTDATAYQKGCHGQSGARCSHGTKGSQCYTSCQIAALSPCAEPRFPDRLLRGTLSDSMRASARWLNDYLDPPASPQELADLLTRAGFPCESSEDVAIAGGADIRQDFETTSNRGDCLCHLGLAREVAALSGRRLKQPEVRLKASQPPASSIVSVENEEHDLCPLYTARVIRGVTVGPSPAWLAERLIARGDIPRNNVVDATNFVLFEMGQPTHVFDLPKLAGAKIIIRRARADEPFLPIGEGAAEVKLSTDDLVIADAERAVAIAGVKGGALTAVTDATTDLLIEAATFDPVTVRNTSRRLGIASDSSFRFERGVAPGCVDRAAERLAALILELAGGELHEGSVAAGKPIAERRRITMRCERCRQLLGVNISDETMAEQLAPLGFQPTLAEGEIACLVPHERLDIEREIDVIEEISRLFGHDNIPIGETIEVRIAPPQPRVLAHQAVSDALAGMGYVEAVTHSLISEKAAAAFVAPDMSTLRLDDERGKAEPVLRPSLLPSLLRVFAHNRDHGVRDVKLFESAAVFGRSGDSHVERVNLAIVHSADSPETGVRQARGVIDRLVEIVLGRDAVVDAAPSDQLPWFTAGAAAKLEGKVLGTFGVLAPDVVESFGLDEPIYAAEIGLPEFYDRYPPEIEAHALPAFPAIERDISAVLDEQAAWASVRVLIASLQLAHLETIDFITTFRGNQIGNGRKSLTLRLRFRAPDRTLTHDEVDPQMEAAMKAIETNLGGVIRK